jgi:hypothetical protein
MTTALFSARSITRTALLGLAATTVLTGCGEAQPRSSIEVISTDSAVPAKSVSQQKPTAPPSTGKPDSPGESGSTDKSGSKGSAGTVRILNGTRNVVIVPVPSFESIAALDDMMRLNLTDGDPKYGLFVFTPVNGKYLIRTSEADNSGEAPCLRVRPNGSEPLTVVAAPCDTSDPLQLFTVTLDKAKKSTYAISNQSAFLQVTSDGELIAEELGDAPLLTTFKLIDNGKAALPALD